MVSLNMLNMEFNDFDEDIHVVNVRQIMKQIHNVKALVDPS